MRRCAAACDCCGDRGLSLWMVSGHCGDFLGGVGRQGLMFVGHGLTVGLDEIDV